MQERTAPSQARRTSVTRRSHRSSIGAAAVVGLAVVGLVGCTTEEPAPIDPEVRWVGAAPSGRLDRDPWVRAVRAELVAEAVARNRNDFSLDAFAKTATPEYIGEASGTAIEALRANETTTLLPGPLPFTPTQVEVGYWDQGDDVAAVRGCVAGNWSMDPGDSLGHLRAFGREFRLERDHAGVMRVASTAGLPDAECDDAGPLPVALFDPVPEPSGVTAPGDLVRPDGTQSAPRRR